jgi:hypothetical protein
LKLQNRKIFFKNRKKINNLSSTGLSAAVAHAGLVEGVVAIAASVTDGHNLGVGVSDGSGHGGF